MALTKIGILSRMTENNRATKVVTKTVELVVVDNQLVPDFREANPGVIQGQQIV